MVLWVGVLGLKIFVRLVFSFEMANQFLSTSYNASLYIDSGRVCEIRKHKYVESPLLCKQHFQTNPWSRGARRQHQKVHQDLDIAKSIQIPT